MFVLDLTYQLTDAFHASVCLRRSVFKFAAYCASKIVQGVVFDLSKRLGNEKTFPAADYREGMTLMIMPDEGAKKAKLYQEILQGIINV